MISRRAHDVEFARRIIKGIRFFLSLKRDHSCPFSLQSFCSRRCTCLPYWKERNAVFNPFRTLCQTVIAIFSSFCLVDPPFPLFSYPYLTCSFLPPVFAMVQKRAIVSNHFFSSVVIRKGIMWSRGRLLRVR